MRVLCATVGYRTEYQLRFFMRCSPEHGDVVVLVVPSPVDERGNEAVGQIREFFSKFFPGVEVEVLEVPMETAEGAVGAIARFLEGLCDRADRVVLCLSGGMRALVLAALAAALYAVPPYKLSIEVELEGWNRVFRFKPAIFSLERLSEEEARVLEAISSGFRRLDELAERTGLPRTTAYKRVKSLVAKGLVEERRRGRRVEYFPSGLAEALGF